MFRTFQMEGGKQITFKERSERKENEYIFWPNSIIVLIWLISALKKVTNNDLIRN
jgi:hypothetical protein